MGAGRKPGTPKTGGRQKGIRNKATIELKDLIDSVIEPKLLIGGIKGIAADVNAPPAARVAAYKELLDRRYGKAPQALTGPNGGPMEMLLALGKATDDQLEELIAAMGGDADA